MDRPDGAQWRPERDRAYPDRWRACAADAEHGGDSKDQAVSLTLLSPWQNRVVHALRILLLLSLAVMLIRDREAGGPKAWLQALRLKREARDHA